MEPTAINDIVTGAAGVAATLNPAWLLLAAPVALILRGIIGLFGGKKEERDVKLD